MKSDSSRKTTWDDDKEEEEEDVVHHLATSQSYGAVKFQVAALKDRVARERAFHKLSYKLSCALPGSAQTEQKN
jgi:hypothetical protein